MIDTSARRELTVEGTDSLEVVVEDEEGTRVLQVYWFQPTSEQKARDSGR